MNEQEQITKLAEMISNSKFMDDSNLQIAEMALTMALHWNQDIKEAAPQMYAMLELVISLMDGDSIEDFTYQYQEISTLLAKARGETK